MLILLLFYISVFYNALIVLMATKCSGLIYASMYLILNIF